MTTRPIDAEAGAQAPVSTAGRKRPTPEGIATFAVATLGEFAALFFWRRFITAGDVPLAVLVLWAGFLVERAAVVRYLRLPPIVTDPRGRSQSVLVILTAVTLSEIAIWIAWLQLAEQVSLVLAAVFLAATIHVVHSYEVAVINRMRMGASLRFPGTITLSAVEALGGTGWLYFAMAGRETLGAAVLLGALLLEHSLQVMGLRKDTVYL